MDRSLDSSVVYQGMVRGFGRELIDQLNAISTKNTVPDLTVLLDVPVEIGMARREQTDEQNRIDMESLDFHQKVRDAYLQLASEDTTGRWQVIDASPALEIVEEQVWQLVQPLLNR
jgi:dTMP kinase